MAGRSFREINDEIERICWEGIDVPDADELHPSLDTVQDEVDIEQALDALKMEQEDKIKNIGLFLIEGKSESERLGAEIKRLQGLKTAIDNRCNSVKSYCLMEMVRMGIKRFKSTFVSLSVRKSPTSSEYVKDDDGKPDISNIDPNYWEAVVTYKVNNREAIRDYNAALKAHIDAGGTLDTFEFEIEGFAFDPDKTHMVVR